jgi:hypothetical protein
MSRAITHAVISRLLVVPKTSDFDVDGTLIDDMSFGTMAT